MKKMIIFVMLALFLLVFCWDVVPRYRAGCEQQLIVFDPHYYNHIQFEFSRFITKDLNDFYDLNRKYPDNLTELYDTMQRYSIRRHSVAIYVSEDAQRYLLFVVKKDYVSKTPFVGGFKKQVPKECARECLYWYDYDGEMELLEVFSSPPISTGCRGLRLSDETRYSGIPPDTIYRRL